MTLDEARARVGARISAMIPEGAESAKVDAAQIPAVFAGTDLYGPGVTRWLQEQGAGVCSELGVSVEDGTAVAGEMLRVFLVGFELGRARPEGQEGEA